MTEPTNPDSQNTHETFLILHYLRRQPALAISISYVLLTLCGIVYSFYFYRQFDIQVLKLANVSDLLIAGISEPAAILMFAGGLLFMVISEFLFAATSDLREKWLQKPGVLKRILIYSFFSYPKKLEYRILMSLLLFVLYGVLFVGLYVDWQVKELKQGAGPKVELTSKALQPSSRVVTLLGSTTNFLITYDLKDESAIVISVEIVQKLEPLAKEPSTESKIDKTIDKT